MAWLRCGKHLVQRILWPGQQRASLPCGLMPSVVLARQQRQRYLHNRLQSAWDAAKSNVARVPSVLPSRPRYEMSFCRKFTAVVVFGGIGYGGLTVYDDYLIFQHCSKSVTLLVAFFVSLRACSLSLPALSCVCNPISLCRRALAKANSDSSLKTILGENIEQGPWYEATMAVDHGGHSAICHFPVSGSLASANIHLRAVRYEEKNNFMSYFVLLGSGEWELLVLEALIHRPDQPNPQRIDLLGRDNFAPGCAR